MSSAAGKKLLAIPGPIELSPTVQHTLGLPPLSHVGPEFVKIFREAIGMTRWAHSFSTLDLPPSFAWRLRSNRKPEAQVVRTSHAGSQAFILAGSGTLGWDQVGANLIEKGDNALVLHTGYFGDGFRDCLQTYGAKVDVVHSPLGGTVRIEDVKRALRNKQYKLVTITHVDTSTSVLSDAQAISECVRRVSPNTLIVLDAVCSLASEDVRTDDWGLDIVLSASQKGLGAPPGLSILVASSRAIGVWEERERRGVKSGSYYSSWEKWLPIMRAYDQGKPAYFGTPAVNLLRAYHASLLEITQGQISLDERLALHKQASGRVKAAAERLGMVQVAKETKGRAHGMTALYVPPGSGLMAADVLPLVGKRGVVMAGGLVAEIKERYIRVGRYGLECLVEEGVVVMVEVVEEGVGVEEEVEERTGAAGEEDGNDPGSGRGRLVLVLIIRCSLQLLWQWKRRLLLLDLTLSSSPNLNRFPNFLDHLRLPLVFGKQLDALSATNCPERLAPVAFALALSCHALLRQPRPLHPRRHRPRP
ncbi:hypothetical protein NLJ89_g1415 [Agrocybe chaxingu]|uniref:Aminotransferase class V domain-containing protein n=1 Tax=Agrocybe chaxingu TaxID=84603 RepID=A0A9W8N025_9AGAR|nr:hypothetical protein NLJ89_g1415 [Agrocybe chaxingu]